MARFVIQRHRARSLHYDFRLEIDGVLVSWAVPKGVTLDPTARHLAVHVEDHPLDYELFEGVIPAGESGGGDVIVWDRGTWELHGADNARAAVDAGEIHVELHGEKLQGRVVLVRTGAASTTKENWLVIHKRDDAAVVGWDPENHPQSVISGRTNDEVAANPKPRTDVHRPATVAGNRVNSGRSDLSSRLLAARERVHERSTALRISFDEIVAASDTANLDDEHDPEGSTVGFERAQVSALLEQTRAQLAEIDAALDRVERGEYGMCETCGCAIPTERLAAQPAATKCVTCAAA